MQSEKNSDILLQSLIGYSKRVKELLPKIYGKTPRACVNTYGCQQNVSDSEHIKGMLVEMGYELCEEPIDADFILFNTCAVRAHAEDRVFGNIGATKQQKREKKRKHCCR